MPHLLENPNIRLLIDLPQENYQLPRFDWTGKIAEVYFKGKAICTREKNSDIDEHRFGKGFYNEFGMDTALGFEEAKEGGFFHKVGVGLLKKEGPSYDFQHAYEVEPAQFELTHGPGYLEIRCVGSPTHGYAYLLTKKIELLEKGFRINYHLQNTGSKPIITQEYTHNFLCTNHALMDESYQLGFPFELAKGSFEETINPGQVVYMEDGKVGFRHTAGNVFFFSQLSGGRQVEAHWKLTNHREGLAISERGSFPTQKVNLWGASHVISPEIFVDIHVLPEKAFAWNRTFEVGELS